MWKWVFMVGFLRGGRPITDIGAWGGRGWQSGILGDFWRSWPGHFKSLFFFLPPPSIPPNHNKAASLVGINKLMLLQFAPHTHAGTSGDAAAAHGGETHGKTRGHAEGRKKKRRPLHMDADSACPQFIMHKHSVVLIISDA